MSDWQLEILLAVILLGAPSVFVWWGFVGLSKRHGTASLGSERRISIFSFGVGAGALAVYLGYLAWDQFGARFGFREAPFWDLMQLGSLVAIAGIGVGSFGKYHPKLPAILLSGWVLALWMLAAVGQMEH